MPITVKARYDYGQLRFYPVSKEAEHLAKLTKTTTFTVTMLRHAKAMGATLECVNLGEIPSGVLSDLSLFSADKGE